MSTTGSVLDAARGLVVERDLARAAFAHLTPALMAVPFEALGPTKTLLKRFFSSEPWSADDDEALAAAVGPGEGHWRQSLDEDLTLAYGWGDGRFTVRVSSAAAGNERPPSSPDLGPMPGDPLADDPLAGTFDGPVVPEATPNPRTIRFHVGPIHNGPSRWYESAARVDDDLGAARLFAEFDDVANVLVGPDFVAVGLHRAADWERLLRSVLAVVTAEFAPAGSNTPDRSGGARVMGGPAGAGTALPGARAARQSGEPGARAARQSGEPGARAARQSGGDQSGDGRDAGRADRHLTRVEVAWRELGSLRPADPADLAHVRTAAAGDDPSRRQVAANLLREGDPAAAADDWGRLVTDPVRSVRRATVDSIVDVGREELRPLLETALADADAWVRWKALRGLAELGPEPSRAAIAARADDRDFRVRLEVAATLRAADPPAP